MLLMDHRATRITFTHLPSQLLLPCLVPVSVCQSAPSIDAFHRGQGAASKIFKVIDRAPEIDSEGLAGAAPEMVKGELALSGVHFVYPARPGAQIFRGLSLRFPAGKMAALVGESGCGADTHSVDRPLPACLEGYSSGSSTAGSAQHITHI
jgi:ABC-type multidrug transport system fused ATPase/permease subunit